MTSQSPPSSLTATGYDNPSIPAAQHAPSLDQPASPLNQPSLLRERKTADTPRSASSVSGAELQDAASDPPKTLAWKPIALFVLDVLRTFALFWVVYLLGISSKGILPKSDIGEIGNAFLNASFVVPTLFYKYESPRARAKSAQHLSTQDSLAATAEFMLYHMFHISPLHWIWAFSVHLNSGTLPVLFAKLQTVSIVALFIGTILLLVQVALNKIADDRTAAASPASNE